MGMIARTALLACCASLAACATLTKSQVQAVNDFAGAAAGYEELPPRVLRAYDEVRFGTGVLAATTARIDLPGVDAFNNLAARVDQSVAVQAGADELRAALEILKTYVDLLKTLSSDQFTADLEDKAKQVGRSLDRAVDQYNQHFPHQLSSFGGIAAAAVGAAGGVFLRIRQGAYLKEFVTRVNALLPPLLFRIRTLAAIDLDGELPRLHEVYLGLAHLESTLELEEAKALTDLIRKAKDAQRLQVQVLAATDGFAAAHQRLYEALQQKQDLPGQLEPVLALGEQVRHAAALKNNYQ